MLATGTSTSLSINTVHSGNAYYRVCIENQCSNPIYIQSQGVLSVPSLSVDNPTPLLGQTARLTSITQCNGGTCPENTVFYIRSNDPVIQYNDDIVASRSLPQLNNGEPITKSILIQAESNQDFYYGACINQQCSNPVRVTTQGTLSFLPLSIDNPLPSLNDNIQLTGAVQCNDGVCPDNTVSFHLSNDPVIQSNDNILGKQPLAQLNDGNSKPHLLSLSPSKNSEPSTTALVSKTNAPTPSKSPPKECSLSCRSPLTILYPPQRQYPTHRRRPMQRRCMPR